MLIINEDDKVPQPGLHYHAKHVKTEILKPRSCMPMMHHLCKLTERRKEILLELCMGSLLGFFFSLKVGVTVEYKYLLWIFYVTENYLLYIFLSHIYLSDLLD